MNSSIPIAVKLMRPKLEPRLKKRGFEWADIAPLLEQVDTVEEVEQAIEDPEAFFKGLMNSSIPLAVKLMRPKLEPRLKKRGFEWADIAPLLEQVDTVEEVEQAIEDPE